MATPILTGNPATPSTPTREFGKLGPNAAGLLYGLFDRARDNLNEDDLTSLSSIVDEAQSSMRHMADVCEGLGCLVLGDGGTDGVSTGSFQDARSVASLLFLLGVVANHADGLLTLATAADNQREVARHAGGAA